MIELTWNEVRDYHLKEMIRGEEKLPSAHEFTESLEHVFPKRFRDKHMPGKIRTRKEKKLRRKNFECRLQY